MSTAHHTATLDDVAREAGVSLATASRVLNGSTRKVAASYRDRVEKAAAALGYTPNLSAQTMAKGTSTVVALIVADIADPYFAQIAAGVARAAEAAGLIVTVSVAGRDSERETALVRLLRGQRPRAMVLAASRQDGDLAHGALRAELDAYAGMGGAVAVIGRNELGFATALVDNVGAAQSLGESMVTLGYRETAVVAGPVELRTSTDRVDGFAAALVAAGAPEPRVVRGEFTRDGGYGATRQLLAEGLGGVQLIFAANDVMALGVLAAVRDAGLTPGVDVAVCGFDDIQTVRDVTPPLTTVHIPLEELGAIALACALGSTSPQALVTRVVLRASTPAL